MSDLHIRYRGYDDEALATLANVGLLRRAQRDVEAGKVAILAATVPKSACVPMGRRYCLTHVGQRTRAVIVPPPACVNIFWPQ